MKKKDWKDITLKQFLTIQELLTEPDEYLKFNLLDVVYGIDSASLTVSELAPYKDALNFLNESIPHVKLLKEYTLNGVVYESNFDLTVVTVAQFVDYQNYIREENPSFNKLLSVFFVPKGMEYNKGYDVKKVQEDLLELDICSVVTLAFFFEIQLSIFLSSFQRSSIKSVKKMKVSKEQKRAMIKKLEEMDLSSLISFH